MFLGAAWGIFEATAGYLLHLSGLRIGRMIWFPVAYFFIHQAYRYTNSIPAVMLTALTASSFKLINLFFPGRIDTVLNPAVSIILEALSVMLVYQYVIDRQLDKINPLTVLLTGMIWRTLYICYILCMPQSFIDIAPFTTISAFLEFMLFNNVVNAALISAGFFAAKVFQKQLNLLSNRVKAVTGRRAAMKPALAAMSMALAMIIQVVLR